MVSNDEGHLGLRVERFGDAIYDVAVDHPMWIGDDGKPLDYNPEREARLGDFIDEATRAVMAVADAEQAELRAEVDALPYCSRVYYVREKKRAEAAETKVAELRRIIMQGGQDATSVRRQAIAALDAE